MTKQPPRDRGASVRGRLLRLARAHGEDFQRLLTRYANERLLFRLGASPHGRSFVLKGAALFTFWTGKPHRATRDVDLLGLGDCSEAHIREVFTQVLAPTVEDGVVFDPNSMEVGPIREDQVYGGVRVEVIAHVTSAKLRLQVDVGFGDAITPKAVLVELPSLLDFPAPRLRVYPRETVVAEKLEAMVQLGMANSRMKDFYDLALIARMFDFDGRVLSRAIRTTFERRRTPLPRGLPLALTTAFADDAGKNVQWTGFVRKSGAVDAGSLSDTITTIAAFVEMPLRMAAQASAFPATRWQAGGPWRSNPE
ncbi:nucleotidyl transferase AbiEii/AbiGii toxin family protein [Paraliomyxa miuraensis]|uniref:nucleotidyl transferase AbiEii/AbiGii toxin family protein n=1 Tax=Paraliomyxa miuraensis TaxID=376150 RepID=UPI002259923F|nr:nucleotidyl transferase AbiEii/AbiGii toxin family protein [Paraliomyxa miuraensis]MCX4241649.1 nucleotidyl transferase AbiEii/AbiGii toxin family protein [Paraliomyxa miuraensis]